MTPHVVELQQLESGHWQNAWNADPSQIRTDVCHLLAAF